MRSLAVAVALLAAACGAPKTQVQPVVLNADDWACPHDPPARPQPLPYVRTPQQLGDYGTRVELAREAERLRGNQCARSFEGLMELAIRRGWIVVQ